MKIELVKLVVKNFKGTKDLTIDFTSITEVFGDNETGKTTLFDSFNWLLFDKDSLNKKDFSIKPLDVNNSVIHGLSPEVEGTLFVDGKRVVLRKVFSEKWTKKRGAGTAEFTGHTTDYFIDDVPVKAKEYKDFIDSMVSEDVFKLVTNPSYFNTQLSWQDRRKVLLEICGEVTDEEVIASNDALAKLPDLLNGRGIEDHRKVIASKRKAINDELDKLPVRIDEAERSKPDTEGLNETELRAEIDQLQFEVQSKEDEISRLQSGDEVTVLRNLAREIEGELLDLKNQAQAGALDAVTRQRQSVQSLASDLADIQRKIQANERDIEEANGQIERHKELAQRLRTEWVEVNATEFVANLDDSCPTCGQHLPEDQVQAAREKALAQFNREKAERLERIAKEGTRKKEQIERLESEISIATDAIGQLSMQMGDAQEQHDGAVAELEHLQSQVLDVSENPEYSAKQQELETINTKIAALRQSVLEEVNKVRTVLMDTRDELRRKESLLARFEQIRKLDKRIDELRADERRLAAEFEQWEEQLFLTEEFIKTKVQVLESRINSKFRHARFKLFETQINGGLAETCETLYHGVPYGSGLNNAARINVGLDIINTLSEHYGLSAPIWIDNAESVTELLETNSQMIALYVSKEDKQLRIEREAV